MCGIAATIDLCGRGRAVPWALDLMRHRGPDGEGVVQDQEGNVVLEHCRLAIIDPDNPEADQPFADPSGRWMIVYNGELFNFKEIRTDLERRGVSFRTNSDTEVVLLGYLHDGESILDRFRGMFAFVIWDQTTGEIFAARDQIGVKPFYYCLQDELFAVCSEVRPLLAHPGFRPKLDPAGVVEFLAFGNNLDDSTLVAGLRKLPPGHCLRIRDGRLRFREYWDALPPDGSEPLPASAANELLDRLDEAVADALVSDVPLGLMLSGGIDSSAVAALAVRHIAAHDLKAYSVAFGRVDDEAAAAARLATQVGMPHRTIRVTEGEVREEFDEWLAGLDYPSGNPTWIASSFIARAAHEDGIKVLLSGDGGDELFGGYSRWMKYLRFHELVWRRMPRAARRAGGRLAQPWTRGLAGDIARRAATDGELFVPSRPWHDDLLVRCLGSAGMKAALASPPERTIKLLRKRFEQRRPSGDYLAWMSYVSLKTTLVEDYLHRLDKMGMRHSVEGRVPLLDPRIVRWALRVEQRDMVPRLRQKALLRDAISPIVPSYVLERTKQGFCAPVSGWVEELLFGRHQPDEGPLFDAAILRPGSALTLRGAGQRASFAAWTLGVLVQWSNRNLEGAPVADPEEVAA